MFSNSKNAYLKDAEVYFEYGVPYMKLIYEYEEKDGVHELLIPKVQFPFICHKLPGITNNLDDINFIFRNRPYINLIDDCVQALNSSVQINGNTFYDVTFMDRLIKPKVREMTIEEVEKELGYSVKIVAKEKDNA